jgi:putative spermidine/putrescine transport system permease protein
VTAIADIEVRPQRPPIRLSPLLVWPALMLGVFFLVPFAMMLATSFYHRVEGGFFEPAFELDNYARLMSAFFGKVLGFSLLISALAAAVTVAIGFPFTYFLTRLRRSAQVRWLVFILAVLSLSEVIIGFTWSSLLSRTAGISNVLVWLGLMESPQAWFPSFQALLIGMVYIGLPFCILVLYPALSRLDRQLPEASRMLGASPLRTFFRITVPIMRNALLTSLVMVFVFDLGCYLLPQVLGRPEHWTLSVLITDQALFQANIPFAAALAIFLMLVTIGLVVLTVVIGRRRAAA